MANLMESILHTIVCSMANLMESILYNSVCSLAILMESILHSIVVQNSANASLGEKNADGTANVTMTVTDTNQTVNIR